MMLTPRYPLFLLVDYEMSYALLEICQISSFVYLFTSTLCLSVIRLLILLIFQITAHLAMPHAFFVCIGIRKID